MKNGIIKSDPNNRAAMERGDRSLTVLSPREEERIDTMLSAHYIKSITHWL